MTSERMLLVIALILAFSSYGASGNSLKCSACQAVAVCINTKWHVSIDAFGKIDDVLTNVPTI